MRRRRLTSEDIVSRMAQAGVDHWLAMNRLCPTCYTNLHELPADANLYYHMVGECEKELLLIGPGWIRHGENVDCPMADAAARREVKAPKRKIEVSNESI